MQLFQSTPLLMQLFLIFFGLSLAGYQLSALVAAAIALTLNSSAFVSEIWRGCIQAIPRSQWDGSESLGLTFFQQLYYVIVPQALRIAIPPTTGFSVQIVKETSLTSIIGFVELSRSAQLLNNATFEPLPIYGALAAIYFVLCFSLSMLSRRLEAAQHVRG